MQNGEARYIMLTIDYNKNRGRKVVIDTHVHIFPDKLCPKTIENLAVTDPQNPLTYYGDGSLAAAEKNMVAWGVDLGVIVPIATRPGQEKSINGFAAQAQHESDYFVAFGSVHPDSEDFEDILDQIMALGLHGIKLHPDYQGFFINEKRLWPLYAAISERQLPVVFHTGYDPVSPGKIHADPLMVREVAEAFPNMTIIAAHTGGLYFYDGPRTVYMDTPNVYFDTAIASLTYRDTPQDYRALIDLYGAERFVFATDNPWGNGKIDQKFLREAVGVTDEEWQAISHQNAQRLIQL